MSDENHQNTALITGAAGALGSALSGDFARAGWNIVMLDKNRRGLEKAWDAIVAEGGAEPFLHPLDLAKAGPDDLEVLIGAIESEFGGLDGVVHCAARFGGLRPLDHIPPPDWLESMQVNVNAAWLLSMSCLPLLRKSERAFLYFLLEDLDKMRRGYWGAYGAGKLALSAMVQQLAAEQPDDRLQVLGINPGPMASALRAEAYHAEDPHSMPDPGIASGRIMDLVNRVEVPAQTLVSFSG